MLIGSHWSKNCAQRANRNSIHNLPYVAHLRVGNSFVSGNKNAVLGSGSGSFRQNRVGLVRVESGNVIQKIKLLNFLLRGPEGKT